MKLTAARKESGLTQAELSKISGLNQRAISRIESNSDVSPTLKTLIKYINALGFDLELVKRQL